MGRAKKLSYIEKVKVIQKKIKKLCVIVGRRSIVDKSSTYGVKGPGFTTWWRQEFININCMFY